MSFQLPEVRNHETKDIDIAGRGGELRPGG